MPLRKPGPFDWMYKTRRWKMLRQVALARDLFLCRRCFEAGILTKATVVHHVQPVELAPWLMYVLDNLSCLCQACHNSVHRKGFKTVAKESKHHRARIVKT